MNPSFCFILTPADIDGELPIEVIPGHWLKRAHDEQQALGKELLRQCVQPLHPREYEFDLVEEKTGTGNGQTWIRNPLPPTAWRYWVIESTGANTETGYLGMAASLLRSEIELGFEFIWHFSIIEALIAHRLRLNESLDSINQQIKSKMYLLAKRFQRTLNYQAFFGQLSEEKVWTKLYALRSAIAHGGLVDYSSDFRVLRDAANVRQFLREVVKLLLLFAMNEPVLLADLKKC